MCSNKKVIYFDWKIKDYRVPEGCWYFGGFKSSTIKKLHLPKSLLTENEETEGRGAIGGYFLAENLAVVGLIGYNHVGGDDETPDRVSLGVQGRYYIIQNGIYLGVGATYKHANHNYNDIMPGVEIGYAFFINRHVTIEPAVYYEQSFKDHSKFSNVGLRLGLGIYLF